MLVHVIVVQISFSFMMNTRGWLKL